MDADTDRTAVKTYVPAYQKERWRDHADDLGMSQSEFVRTMVQAGRRGFDPEPTRGEEEGDSPDATPGGDDLEDRVLSILDRRGALGWEELLDALSGDLEQRLDAALDDLQATDRVRYSGREGGYTRVDE